ncbi:S41 family peptidase [Pedobacter boryungensis]|uniref:Tail specific protease domain-containing protein n=1 Tax=Pedobacter boryungensis TaxID=869962 RepID=A0ABX2DB82_9SPHI|nr:S41 family peptidase [Pedobacter boryungensis]NQX31318.1 hypothetical protein [Pedobacter boryungensis]
MRKIAALLFFLCFATASMAQQFSKSDFLEDLTYFKTTLPQRHTNLFSKVTEKEFNAKVNEIELKVDSLNYETFVVELFKLIVAIGDEHTRVEPNFTKVLPIRFEQFSEGIYITGIDAKSKAALLGKLTAVNSMPISEVITRFKTIILHDNPSYFTVGLLNYLNNPGILKGLKIINSTDEAIYTFMDIDGKETNVNLQAVLKNENNNMTLSESYFSMPATKNNDFYSYAFDENKRILYFNYAKCREMEQKPFAKFNEELFTLINDKKPSKIILDLRNNSGGNSAILKPFIEKISKSYLNTKKSFYVLIGKKTFSSALMNAVDLKKNLSVTLVGETTSGNINHYGEVRGFILPKSKLTIGYSTKYWENWKGKKGALIPDVKINYSVANFKNGKDEALELIYRK